MIISFIKKLKSPIIVIYIFSTILFVLFYPSFYTLNDERNYIQNAYWLANGENLVRDSENCIEYGNEAYGFYNDDGCISKYNLGLSVLLAPIVGIDWQLSFILIFIFYLLSVFVFSKILNLFKLNQNYLYLFALFPPFSYYSHKVMGEIPSLFFLLLFFYILTKVKLKITKLNILNSILLGLIIGLGTFIRYSNVIIFGIIFLYFYYDFFKTKLDNYLKSFTLVTASAGLIGGLIFLLNLELYGSGVSSGYTLAGEDFFFDFNLAAFQFGWYTLILLSMYPLMLISTFWIKGKHKFYKVLFLLIFISFIPIYLGFPGFSFSSGVNNWILGSRFLVPISGFLILGYIFWLDSFINRVNISNRVIKIASFLIISTLLLSKLAIIYRLDERTNSIRNDSYIIYQSDDLFTDGSYILINEAFEKSEKIITNVPEWIPLDERGQGSELYLNVREINN